MVGGALTSNDMEWFRLLNMVSFLASLVTIICSTLVILWFNKYTLMQQDRTAEGKGVHMLELQPWAAALVRTVYLMAMMSFAASVGFAVVAILAAGMGFLTWSSFWVLVGLTISGLAVVVVALVLMGIPETEDRGLLAPFKGDDTLLRPCSDRSEQGVLTLLRPDMSGFSQLFPRPPDDEMRKQSLPRI